MHRAEKKNVKTATNVSPNQARSHEQVIMSQDHRQADFLKGVSHDLRTPLNVIIGICQFLERDQKTPLSPMHQDAVERMERNARALLQSVNHLMEYMRSERSQ
jgi:signal transduction histidine kinase